MASLAPIFRENEILLTGANGFLGKVVLAMLLDRFPQVGRVHVLVRARPGVSSRERFTKEVLDSPPFGPLLERHGRDSIARRVHVLDGDAAKPLASLDPETIRELAGQVSLVLNCAGLVEFFAPVDRSLEANVASVERLLELCGSLNAKLLHISTCYVAGEANGLIEETEPIPGYHPRRSGPDDHRFCAQDELAACRQAAISVGEGLEGARRAEALIELGRVRSARWGWVNTYTYTKSLGEQLLATQHDVPYAIVRPAIVESSLRYPFPGWIEGGRTAAPLALMALGGLLDWPARRDLSLEIIPVDLVAAATLVVAGELLVGRARQIYQLASSDVNPYSLEDLIRLLVAEARRNGQRPSVSPLWLEPFPRLRFLDAAQAERRRQIQLRRIARGRKVLERLGQQARARHLRILELQVGFHQEMFRQYMPFILDNRYVFETRNIQDTYRALSGDDRDSLPWNPEAIDWPAYWRTCQIPGIRRWVQPEAVRQWSFQL